MSEKTNKKANVPNLRFPGFEGEWEEGQLGEVSKVSSGGTPDRGKQEYWNGEIPWITTSLINFNIIVQAEEMITERGLKNSSAKLFSKETVLMAMYGQGKTRGQVAILGIEAATNQACAAIIPNQNLLIPQFLFQNLSKRYSEIRELSNQGGQENLSGTILKGINIAFPSIQEQNKIADFLALMDRRIQTQNKIIEKFETLIKGFREKIFCDGTNDTSNVRFPQFTTPWRQLKLKDLAERIVRKNKGNKTTLALTIAAKNGLIDQATFFNKQVAASDMSNYYLVRNGDFAYNKSYSNDYPWGAVKRLDNYTEGALSTLYFCFRPFENVNSDYLVHYFETSKWHKSVSDISGEGARNHGLLNMSVIDYFNTEHFVPEDLEQAKIASFLNLLNHRLSIEKDLLRKQQQIKIYFLDNIFI